MGTVEGGLGRMNRGILERRVSVALARRRGRGEGRRPELHRNSESEHRVLHGVLVGVMG